MLRKLVNRVLSPIRRAAGRFVILPDDDPGRYVGPHGCIHAAMSFATWNQVEGDYLEFGVWGGASFAAAYRAMTENRREHLMLGYDSPEYRRWKEARPRFFAFDSFEGLPPGPGERQVDYFAGAYECSEEQFKANVARRGVDLDDVVTVKGFYDRTLIPKTKDKHRLAKAAVVMIDVDLYESAVPVLDFLTDVVGQGTVLIFDDWFRFRGSPEHGEQRACREWLAKNPRIELAEFWREGPQAVSFVVNLKKLDPAAPTVAAVT